jgi:pimeloyl-ACP methyl ester carboxylesterase
MMPRPYEVSRVAGWGGVALAVARWPGEGTPFLAVHATGFCKELWSAVADRLAPHPIVAPDQRGHGDSAVPPPPYDWWDLGRDALAVADACGLERPVGLGHSSGAAALVMAELLRPGTFAALMLVEPIIFPFPPVRVEDFEMTRAALRRRPSFPSAEAAAQALRGRGAFTRWPEEALARYVAHAFRAGPGGWALKCAPEIEAEFYRGATAHGAWARLHEVSCPVLLAAGADSDSHSRPFVEEMQGRFGGARLEVVPGADHFLPMERPEVVADLVRALLAPGPERGAG